MDSTQRRNLSLLALCALLQAGCSGQAAIPAAQAQVPASGPAAASAVSDATVASAAPLAGLHLRDSGPADARTTLALALTLRYRNAEQLDRLVAEQSNPRSAEYGRWLSNEQFAASFAPSGADYRKVATDLQRAGFHIDATYANRTVVDASAPVGTIERYFDTTIHRVRPASGGDAYANVRPAYAPRELSGLILAVDGLTTVAIAQPYHDTVKRGDPSHAPKAGSTSLFGPISTATNARGYAPLAFSAGYDLPILHANGTQHYNGSGRASGIVIDADFAESDLRSYLAYFNISRTGPATKRNLLKGGPPQGDGGADSVEAALDAEAIVGSAPGTALQMYEIPELSGADITDAYNTIVSDNKVDTANSSFGGCEALDGKTVRAWSAIAEQGAAKGITFHAATGDSGASLCASAPASSPYMVAVGGTALTVGAGGAWAQEIAWSGSGGGISSLFTLPTWQTGVVGTVNRGRNIPDVALDADPYSGMAFYFTASWNSQYNPIGGTSLSSPLFGAAVTEIDQVKNARTGLIAGSLYATLAADGYGSGAGAYFHDVVQGSNGTFYAGPGYDLVTGIGSIDAWNIAEVLP
jgi:kumamolisin